MADGKGTIIGKTIDVVYETAKGIGEGAIGGVRVLFTGHEEDPRAMAKLGEAIEAGKDAASIAAAKAGQSAYNAKESAWTAAEDIGLQAKHGIENVGSKLRYPSRDPLAKK